MFFLLLFSLPVTVSAELKINEIYPSPESGDEWVEIFNNSEQPIELKEYTLLDKSGKKLLFMSQEILPKQYVTATSDQVLNNSGDTVLLLKGTLQVDIATYSAILSSTQSFSRCTAESDTWQVTNNITKNAINNPCITPTPLVLSPSPSSSPFPESTSKSDTKPLPEGEFDNNVISISEALVYPESGQQEWVELYNNSDSEVTLKNWYIDDIPDGGSTPKEITVSIAAKSYAVVFVSPLFNNSGDSVRLLNTEKALVDSFTYTTSKKQYSWGVKTNSKDICIQVPSPEKENNPCADIAPTGSPSPAESTRNVSDPEIFINTTSASTKVEDYFRYSPVAIVTPAIVARNISIQAVKTNPYKSISHSLAFFSFNLCFLALFYLFIRIRKRHYFTFS